MFKRSTKITSLLVAAASVATMVPAMAADKIADKDGTIYRAVSYKDGKLYIDGKDIEDAKDEDGVFFIDNGSSKEVDSDIDSGDEVTGVYGEKYVEIGEGDYYVDITNGKVTDDQLRNEDRENAASELAKKLRKQDPSRYTEESENDKAQVEDDDIKDSTDEIWEVPAAPYTEPYYQVNYLRFDGDKGSKVVSGTMGKDENNNAIPTVYTDKDGKYIDVDHNLGTVNIILKKEIDQSTTTDDALIIDPEASVSKAEAIKFDAVDSKKNKDKTAEVKVTVEHIATLAADKDYVYRVAALHVGYKNRAKLEYDYKEANPDATTKEINKYVDDVEFDFTTEGSVVLFGSTKNPVAVKASEEGRFYVIQKISKEQGDKQDDAYLPKKTETYLATENKDWRKKGEISSTGDSDDIKIVTETGTKFITDGVVETNKKDDDRTVWINGDFADVYSDHFAKREENDVAYTVADGKVTKYQPDYETFNDNGSAGNGDNDKFVVKTFSLKSSNGVYYIDANKNDEDFEDEDEFATAVDFEGNIWKLDSGKIYKYKNDGGYELKYKCDGGLNELSVYDENNLIAYNEDDDVYAIVGGKSSTGKYDVKDDNATATDTTTTTAAGWVQDATNGNWSYVKADGTKATGWFQSPASGLWYYLDANGIMQLNGWIQDGGYWYFLDATGAMKTGWVYTGGAWYFLKPTNGNKGAMQTGWIQTGGKWYYCNASGAMLSNTTVGGYVLGADGAWIK